ncbi:glycosyl transferase [Mycoavidus sp. B2-EB]|nr:glycosyl transferase [Mycoavidus sp. B2-EB]
MSGITNLTSLFSDKTVDIIVPVFLGLEDTRRCIQSVLTSRLRTPFRLIVINDASPDPEINQYLRSLVDHDPRLLLLENEQNLGFVQTANRGMALDKQRDIVLLNSDAEVANDWLDRLKRAAYSEPLVSSVTPFSNNATICSYPRFGKDNQIPQGFNTATLDSLFSQVNANKTVDIPTAIGFCMYIRRESLSQVGLFDVDNFGKGYGEENDFCMRAHKHGWKHVLALDTFVRHVGSVSFGANNLRRKMATERVRVLHPSYELLVHRYTMNDPARIARMTVDFHRINSSEIPALLFVTHSRGGGTERHIHELATLLSGKANVFALRPYPGGQVQLEWLHSNECLQLYFHFPEQKSELISALRDLGIAHVHYHHLLGHDSLISGLPKWLGVDYDFTAHDYYPLCPQISLTQANNRYCGLEGIEQCKGCLKVSPAPGKVDIESWRSRYRDFLIGARNCLAPSEDTARRFRALLPEINIHTVPHPDLDDCAIPQPTHKPLANDAILRVFVIGALGPIKGADVLEAVAIQAAQLSTLVEFHLIGFAYRGLKVLPKANLTIHGEYKEADLAKLLSTLNPDVVWFPALCPETYSYTLSACLKAGLPIVAPDLGAFPERLAKRSWTWVSAWDRSPLEWLEFFIDIREAFVTGTSPAVLPAVSHVPEHNFYRDIYLDGIKALPQREIKTSSIKIYRTIPELPGYAGRQQNVKLKLLGMLVWLRNTMWLRSVAKRIPMQWQMRVKSWLVR